MPEQERTLPKGCVRLTRGAVADDIETKPLQTKCARCGVAISFRLDINDPNNCESTPAEAVFWGSPAHGYYFCSEEHLPTRSERRASR